jgi:S-adenosyl methyltransferase
VGTEPPDDTFDPTRPHAARVYDYLLGGKNNFTADREVGDQTIARLPEVQVGVLAQRAVLGRVVRADYGVVLSMACAGVARML